MSLPVCSKCKRRLSKKLVEAKVRSKIDNALLSLIKAKANGNKMGRKKLRDDNLIKALRMKGLTIREIASRVGFSTTAVQRGLRS